MTQFALRFISGKYQGGEFPLRMEREIVIGRSSDLDMVLVEDMVSRKHAKITTDENAVTIQDLDGNAVDLGRWVGKRPVIVEFWATWCPICIDTLKWMKGPLGSNARVVAVAVDSEPKDIKEIVQKIRPRAKVVIASPELRRAFNGPPAVPTLLIADAAGKIVKTFYGAPPDLHAQVARELAKLR